MVENAMTGTRRGSRSVVAILVVAILYFLFVLALGINLFAIPAIQSRVRIGDLVLAGSVLFVVMALALVVMLFRRRQAFEAIEAETEAEEIRAAESAVVRPRDDEVVVTNDSYQGLRVLEYSHPPKSQNKGAVYAKCYVPVARDSVVRLEDLIAREGE